MIDDLRVASDYTQLALHALAHLAIPGPGRLDDARYLAWSRAEVPPAARAPVEEDASAIASLWARERAEVLHAMPELFSDLAQARASAARALSELTARDVADPGLLAALRQSAAAELLRGAILLAAPAWARFFRDELADRCARGLERIAPLLAIARAMHSPLSSARVELAFPLGSRGRAFSRRILVGVPGDFAGLDAATPVVLAMHEASVRAHDRGPVEERYVRAEWAALVEVARTVAAAPAELREAHAAWLASLDLEELAEAAATLGLTTAEHARRVATDRAARAGELAR